MNTGDFIYIDFIGGVKDTREIFDVTVEDVAKKENVYNPDAKYKPIPIIVDDKSKDRTVEIVEEFVKNTLL